MSPNVFQQMVERLDECVVPAQHARATETGPHHMPRSLQGRLSHLERQKAEQSATA